MPKAKAPEKAKAPKTRLPATATPITTQADKKPKAAKVKFEQPERLTYLHYYEADTAAGVVRGQCVEDGSADGILKIKVWRGGEPKDELAHVTFAECNVREVTRTYLMEQE